MNDTRPLIFQWKSTDGNLQRVTFRPETQGWLRIESQWTGRRWRDVGCERVEELHFTGGESHV